jgi:hypothetical protein
VAADDLYRLLRRGEGACVRALFEIRLRPCLRAKTPVVGSPPSTRMVGSTCAIAGNRLSRDPIRNRG